MDLVNSQTLCIGHNVNAVKCTVSYRVHQCRHDTFHIHASTNVSLDLSTRSRKFVNFSDGVYNDPYAVEIFTAAIYHSSFTSASDEKHTIIPPVDTCHNGINIHQVCRRMPITN